jgi:hypothetical protein
VSFFIFPPQLTDVSTDLPMAQRTYIVSSPIIAYYYTQIIGDARKPPTLRATSGFNGIAVIGRALLALASTAF